MAQLANGDTVDIQDVLAYLAASIRDHPGDPLRLASFKAITMSTKQYRLALAWLREERLASPRGCRILEHCISAAALKSALEKRFGVVLSVPVPEAKGSRTGGERIRTPKHEPAAVTFFGRAMSTEGALVWGDSFSKLAS